jgi:AcrR family transcriptional regulator
MGILARKEREKLELRNQILEAATELFLKEGFDKTSIRSIAEKIEYSPATIYLYFKDKNEIFRAIHDKGFEMFFEKLGEAQKIENPYIRLRRMGDLYLEFAFEHREFFDLMFIMRAPIEARNKEGNIDWLCGMQSFKLLQATVTECMEKGYMKKMDLDVATITIISLMNGMASLYIRERLVMYDQKVLPYLFRDALDNLMQVFKANPMTSSFAEN